MVRPVRTRPSWITGARAEVSKIVGRGSRFPLSVFSVAREVLSTASCVDGGIFHRRTTNRASHPLGPKFAAASMRSMAATTSTEALSNRSDAVSAMVRQGALRSTPSIPLLSSASSRRGFTGINPTALIKSLQQVSLSPEDAAERDPAAVRHRDSATPESMKRTSKLRTTTKANVGDDWRERLADLLSDETDSPAWCSVFSSTYTSPPSLSSPKRTLQPPVGSRASMRTSRSVRKGSSSEGQCPRTRSTEWQQVKVRLTLTKYGELPRLESIAFHSGRDWHAYDLTDPEKAKHVRFLTYMLHKTVCCEAMRGKTLRGVAELHYHCFDAAHSIQSIESICIRKLVFESDESDE